MNGARIPGKSPPDRLFQLPHEVEHDTFHVVCVGDKGRFFRW